MFRVRDRESSGLAVRLPSQKGEGGTRRPGRQREADQTGQSQFRPVRGHRDRGPGAAGSDVVMGTAGRGELWVEEPAKRRRMPDPVRTAAVRAVLIVSLTLVQAMVAVLCTLADSWLAFPMVLSSVGSTVVATWGVLDVWVTRQVWNQRNGVVSVPASTARRLRRERRRARRGTRAGRRAPESIRTQGGTGQLTHT
ncbi:hypothetical protein [Streptomyces sp. HmicA12]|uniref:hypothetical protein n=1 Tax=Streptomyces sp. HmicA12 TaxID=1156844 RepID=UPI000997069D